MAANTPPGPGVDASGQTVLDPTANVRHEMAAAKELAAAQERRQDDLRAAEARHTRELDAMRDSHAKDLRDAESKRIDAIRTVDVNAVQQAALVATTQATTLAAQVAASAEAMRTQVAAAAVAATQSQATALEPIQKSIDDLRRVQYEAVGQKTQVVETQARGGSVGLWVGVVVAVLAMMVTAIGSTVAIILSR